MKITAVIVDRANYGRLKPLLSEISHSFELSIICCGSTVLDRFHKPCYDISAQFKITHSLYHEVEGSNDESSIASMSSLMPQLMMALKQENPDYVLIIGDRFEALTVATVAMMLKLCIIHVQGGEHSGNRDECIRHAITKLSHYHLPATLDAAANLVTMGERKETILGVGCPSAEIAARSVIDEAYTDKLLCVFHPEDGINNKTYIRHLLMALATLKKDVVMLWPNIDPGSDGINKVIRRFIAQHKPEWLRMEVNFNPVQYMNILKSVRCCIGNSSSFVRDASFFGTPVLLIGNRQIGRVKTKNIKQLDYDVSDLAVQITKQRERPSGYYGKPGICREVVERLKNVEPYWLKGCKQ